MREVTCRRNRVKKPKPQNEIEVWPDGKLKLASCNKQLDKTLEKGPNQMRGGKWEKKRTELGLKQYFLSPGMPGTVEPK